jgi:hypothetical protein
MGVISTGYPPTTNQFHRHQHDATRIYPGQGAAKTPITPRRGVGGANPLELFSEQRLAAGIFLSVSLAFPITNRRTV